MKIFGDMVAGLEIICYFCSQLPKFHIPTMVSKTRDKLIEVARQLFAHKGLENTTMNDIAAASDKGRRTIYTYFKNKRDIYNAVIERESEQLISRLRVIKDNPELSPEEKLRVYLDVRFDFMLENNNRHEGFLQYIGRDFRRVDRIRKLAVIKEIEMFKELIADGVKQGVFDARQAARLPFLESMAFEGFDYCNIRGLFDEYKIDMNATRTNIIEFITSGIMARSEAETSPQ